MNAAEIVIAVCALVGLLGTFIVVWTGIKSDVAVLQSQVNSLDREISRMVKQYGRMEKQYERLENLILTLLGKSPRIVEIIKQDDDDNGDDDKS